MLPARGLITKYLTTILRLSYDNAKVTIDSRRTSSAFVALPNLRYINALNNNNNNNLICKTYYKERKVFPRYDSLAKWQVRLTFLRQLAYDIPKRNLSTSFVTVVSRSHDKLTIVLR